jgi:hypothetical protein
VESQSIIFQGSGTMNMGKQLIRKTTFFNQKSRTLSFVAWKNFASIENMAF